MSFSALVMDHFHDPRNVGSFEDPDGCGRVGSFESGRFMVMGVRLDGDTVREVRFRTYGCVPAIAAGSFLSQWASGRSLSQVRDLGPRELAEALGGLPPGREFCAEMAVLALRMALDDAARRRVPRA